MSLRHHLKAARNFDPAARSKLELLLLYPGIHAIFLHRIAHKLWVWKLPFIPRMISQLSRWFTGIEIHPGAIIGQGVFMDHGMGVVIGETAEVGDCCLIYQGVTLGGTSLEQGKRHPTLEDHIVVGSGAKVLGDIRIGSHSRIGSNSVVVKSVPPHSVVVGVPGRIRQDSVDAEAQPLAHQAIPDATIQLIQELTKRINELENEVKALQAEQSFAEVDSVK